MSRYVIGLCFLLNLIALPTLAQSQSARDFAFMLPVKTLTLTPGKVKPRELSQPIRQPIFIVGADAASHRWIKHHYTYLKRIKAKGIAVNVRTTAQLQALMNHQLPIYPLQGDEMAEIFSLSHYPVLLEQGALKQ